MADVDVVATELKALRDLLDLKVENLVGDVAELKQAVAEMSNNAVTPQMCGIHRGETKRLITKIQEFDDRFTRLERVYWLQVGLYGFTAPIVVWYVIQLLSGGIT